MARRRARLRWRAHDGGAGAQRRGLEPVELLRRRPRTHQRTDGMLGQLVLAIEDGYRLLKTADVAAALSVQALRAPIGLLRGHPRLRPIPASATARPTSCRSWRSRRSSLARRGHDQVQDAYSLRCAPQVHARLATPSRTPFASRTSRWRRRSTTLRSGRRLARVQRQLPRGSRRLRHGLPAIVLADVASMSERRTDRMLDVDRSFGLPPFLAHQPASIRD